MPLAAGFDPIDPRVNPRIALVHATALAIQPVGSAFRRLWPEARLMNVLDDSLSADRAAAGKLTQAMIHRFDTLARYCADNGADGILFTCSAFGPAIEATRSVVEVPVLKPNEAMLDEALAAAIESWADARDCDALLLAQFSMARACDAVQARIGIPVLVSTDSAVRAMRKAMREAPATFTAPPSDA